MPHATFNGDMLLKSTTLWYIVLVNVILPVALNVLIPLQEHQQWKENPSLLHLTVP